MYQHIWDGCDEVVSLSLLIWLLLPVFILHGNNTSLFLCHCRFWEARMLAGILDSKGFSHSSIEKSRPGHVLSIPISNALVASYLNGMAGNMPHIWSKIRSLRCLSLDVSPWQRPVCQDCGCTNHPHPHSLWGLELATSDHREHLPGIQPSPGASPRHSGEEANIDAWP